jgi:hypothetical protein
MSAIMPLPSGAGPGSPSGHSDHTAQATRTGRNPAAAPAAQPLHRQPGAAELTSKIIIRPLPAVAILAWERRHKIRARARKSALAR